jgi:hypothetical protein
VSDPTGISDTDNAELLTDELARKYDPERLLRMIARKAGRGERLDHSIRAKYEKRFGVDLGHVRLFTGEFAEEFNRKRNAYAVTVGSTGMILMGGSPEKSMASASGQALLAHELTHVAQAQRGLHRKATFDGGMPFTEEHEDEAEAVESEESGSSQSSGMAAAQAAHAQEAAKEALQKAIEEVTQRVQDLAAEAARTHGHRNGSQRRA